MSILKVEGLTKRIKKKEILKDVTFSIEKGDIVAFIGPNGAGKTTTIKCILGLQKPTKGNIYINENDIKKNFKKAMLKVGAIVETPDICMYLSGMEILKMTASFYKNITMDDIDETIKLVGLEKRIYDKVSKYSLGMRQRLGLAISLLNKPDLLILDEPTNGLDPEGIKELRDLLVSLAKKGTGILISSHNLGELESFCNKVLIISKGKILTLKPINEIKKVDENKYIIRVDNPTKAQKLIAKNDIIKDNCIEKIIDEDGLAEFLKKLILHDIKVYEVNKVALSLEEAFISIAGGNKID